MSSRAAKGGEPRPVEHLPPLEVRTFRQHAIDNGYALVRVRSQSKRPLPHEWQHGDKLDSLLNVSPDALNTGLLLGGMRCVDCDIDDPQVAGQIIGAVQRHLPKGAIIRRRANSSRVAILYRAADGEPGKRVVAGPKGKIEVLGLGQQVVIHGLHPSGATVTWLDGRGPDTVRRRDLPTVSEEQISELFEMCASVLGANPVPATKPPGGAHEQVDRLTETSGWFNNLTSEKQSEVARYAALHIARNSKLFELTENGGDNDEYFKLALAIARSGVSNAEEIFVEAATMAKDADPEEKLRKDFQACKCADSHIDSVTVGTLLYIARQYGADFTQWKRANSVSLEDFYAYMPLHSYIFAPSREHWPASSVNSRLGAVPLLNFNGTPANEKGDEKKISASEKKMSASAWLDRNRPVEQMTWAPGLPMLVRDRLISEGGWIERDGVACFNLYRPPTIEPGYAAEADRWLDHIHKVFGDDGKHIVRWLAHRVQHPQEKINHAIVLGGNQGIGKDTILEPAKHAVGPWNFAEVSPQHLLGRFNGFLKSVILRVSEARDLGEINRFGFYDHMKAYTAAPPDVLRVDEKNLREHNISNCCGVIITTNHKADGIYLPADDRRHYVAWSNLTKKDFVRDYWTAIWDWYELGGIRHVAAYLAELDISSFDPKAPPLKTAAFWDIVDASRAPEDAELADVLDGLGRPDATTIIRITNEACGGFEEWMKERKNRRAIPHRLEKCGYVSVRNDAVQDGLWVINGSRQVVYAKSELSTSERFKAASDLARQMGPSLK
jgi:Family of unknown function (DUF5906)/Bifunctional DNA primase/polymerase, N-terminal